MHRAADPVIREVFDPHGVSCWRAERMTKAELVAKVATKVHLTRQQTDAVVTLLCRCIIEALKEGENVELRGFGRFCLRQRQPREGRNPKTGEPVQIPAKKVPFFKAGKALRARVDRP
jgi:integration host factor subunit beta